MTRFIVTSLQRDFVVFLEKNWIVCRQVWLAEYQETLLIALLSIACITSADNITRSTHNNQDGDDVVVEDREVWRLNLELLPPRPSRKKKYGLNITTIHILSLRSNFPAWSAELRCCWGFQEGRRPGRGPAPGKWQCRKKTALPESRQRSLLSWLVAAPAAGPTRSTLPHHLDTVQLPSHKQSVAPSLVHSPVFKV